MFFRKRGHTSGLLAPPPYFLKEKLGSLNGSGEGQKDVPKSGKKSRKAGFCTKTVTNRKACDMLVFVWYKCSY